MWRERAPIRDNEGIFLPGLVIWNALEKPSDRVGQEHGAEEFDYGYVRSKY